MKKYLTIDHMKFPLANSHHNALHWLIVVLIRIIYFSILFPISAYLVFIGFLFSAESIKPYLPAVWFEKAIEYYSHLPYFLTIKKLIFDFLGHWYRNAPVWWTVVIGIPLITIGISIFFIGFFNLYHSISSSNYNQTHCPLCRQPESKSA